MNKLNLKVSTVLSDEPFNLIGGMGLGGGRQGEGAGGFQITVLVMLEKDTLV